MPDYVNRNKIFEAAWEINVNLVKEDLPRVPKNNPETTTKDCVTWIRWTFWTTYLGGKGTKYFSDNNIRYRLHYWKQPWNPIFRKSLGTPDIPETKDFLFQFLVNEEYNTYLKHNFIANLRIWDNVTAKLFWSKFFKNSKFLVGHYG